MKTYELADLIVRRLVLTPTAGQRAAVETFTRFLADREPRAVMVMRGSAGTGKTSLAAAMVRTLHALGQKLCLMAPTGRAAKVFARSCGMPAYTIHRTIYREKSHAGPAGSFDINFNKSRDTLFVVDEASMISGRAAADSTFGSGSLLDDLITFVYGGHGCRLLLIGDRAQLPPVGEAASPALSASVLAGHAMRVYQCDLSEVLRQGERSGILHNATAIRDMITGGDTARLPKIEADGFDDITMVTGGELIESLEASYAEVGEDETLVITRSNKRANLYNQGIRSAILGRDGILGGGDRLMVVRNKYISSPGEAGARQTATRPGGAATLIANGDRCVVRRARRFEDLYGFHFAEATLLFPDYGDRELETTVILDTLAAEAPALTPEQSDRLFSNVMADYQDLPLKADRMRAARDDRHLNALQVKFAYAVTCHKAQGGQWRHVYVDQGFMTDDMLTTGYLRWLYTAVTRATTKLFLVNWPPTQRG